MIKKIDLKNYGKFTDTAFNFGLFTIITGPNEAGKTTLFDALLESLCIESKGKNSWKPLIKRYGANRIKPIALFDPPEEKLNFDDAEFLEIFAIRAGQNSLLASGNSKGKSSWVSTAENALLNDGINPERLSLELAKFSKSAAAGTPLARIEKLKDNISKNEFELNALLLQKQTILDGEKDTINLKEQIAALTTELDKKIAELNLHKTNLEALFASCKLAATLGGIKLLRELGEAETKLAAMQVYANNEIHAYRAIISTLREKESAFASLRATVSEKELNLTTARSALSALSEKEPGLHKLTQLADNLTQKINEFTSQPGTVILIVNTKLRYGTWAAGAVLAAFTAYSAHNTAGYIVALALIAATVWAGLKISIREQLKGHSQDDISNFFSGLAAQWTGEVLTVTDTEAAREFFAKVKADYAAVVENIAVKSKELTSNEVTCQAALLDLREREKAVEAAKMTAENWLTKRGCVSEDAYLAQIAEHQTLSAEYKNLVLRTQALQQTNSCINNEELKDRLFTDKEGLERKGTDPAAADEAKLERQTKLTAPLEDKIRLLEKELSGLNIQLTSAQTRAGTLLENLPGKINSKQIELLRDRDEIKELGLQIEAYNLAASIFHNIAENSRFIFSELSRAVSATLSQVLLRARTEFDSFDPATAEMQDAAGKLRFIENLSTGTKDLFMLAARLTIAKKARTGADGKITPALLVLDEPFYTMDEERLKASLRLLASFQNETSWQIILFTKDPQIAAYAQKIQGLAVSTINL